MAARGNAPPPQPVLCVVCVQPIRWIKKLVDLPGVGMTGHWEADALACAWCGRRFHDHCGDRGRHLCKRDLDKAPLLSPFGEASRADAGAAPEGCEAPSALSL